MEQFSCKTRIIFGAGTATHLAGLQIGRLLMVTDPFFFENGTAQQIARGASSNEVEYFHKVTPDPSVALAAEGAAAVQAFNPDAIVALGGGSAMDCAKAMAYFSGTSVRLIAIPTTSGSGSEVTDFAILTHDGIKHPLVDERLRPDVAIIDRTLVKNLPPALIADGGFDVLTHALEAYTATNAGAVTDALARDAFQTTFRQLIHSFRGDQTARGQVHEAATMAGMAFTQAGLGLCHALAHSLGGVFHIPHGRLNAILLPAVIRCNSPSAGEKYAALARAAGLEGRAVSVGVRNLRNAFIRLRRELALPGSLAEAGVSSAQLRKNLDRIIQAALEDPCCKTNPQPVTADMVRAVVQEAAGHG